MYPDSDTVLTRGIIWFPVISRDRNSYHPLSSEGRGRQEPAQLSVVRGTMGGSEPSKQSKDSVVGVTGYLERGQAASPSSIVPESTSLCQHHNSPTVTCASIFHRSSRAPTLSEGREASFPAPGTHLPSTRWKSTW